MGMITEVAIRTLTIGTRAIRIRLGAPQDLSNLENNSASEKNIWRIHPHDDQ